MRRRILVATLIVSGVAVVVFGITIAYLVDRVVGDEARDRAARQAERIAIQAGDALVSGSLFDADQLTLLTPPGDQAIVTLPDGATVTAGSVGGEAITVTVDGPRGTTVTLSIPEGPVRLRVQRATLVLELLGAGTMAIAAAAAWVQARQLVRPLDTVAAAAERLGAGDFSTIVAPTGLPEVDAVGEALNKSAERIAELVKAEREFSANASHQLRTALTAMRLRLEGLSMNADPEVHEEAMAALKSADRLDAAITELLALARTGRAGVAVDYDIVALVRAHTAEWQPVATQTRRSLSVHAPGSLLVHGTPGAVGQAFDVLLSNALRHGDGDVDVTIEREGQYVAVSVADEGSGIEPAHVAGLFEPKPLDLSGHGIGLALAASLVQSEGGRLTLAHNAPPVFRMELLFTQR
ncbi:MAG: ATP-binding protein [Acidimicrobiia bacterium]